MGGVRQPLRLGWRLLPELNLSANPEAAASVLAAPCPVTLMSAEICLQAAFSWRDLILIGGGLFLIAKATHEIHQKIEGAGGSVTVL